MSTARSRRSLFLHPGLPAQAWDRPERTSWWRVQFVVWRDQLISAALLAGLLASVGWSIQLSRWIAGPGPQVTLLIAEATALILVRIRLRLAFALPAAFAIGFVVVFWQAGHLASGSNIIATSRDIWERAFAWLQAAKTGGISRDPLPFEVMLLTASWIAAYASGWALFRRRNAWVATFVFGTGILMNLSYRPGKFEYTLYLFLASAVILFAYMTALNNQIRWRESGVAAPSAFRRLSLQYGIFVAASIAIVAAVLPLWEPSSATLQKVWTAFRSPVVALEGPVDRLLAGVNGNGGSPLARFTPALPFQGPISLSDAAVMTVKTNVPTLHPGHIYSVYTSKGWTTGPTDSQTVPAEQGLLPPTQDQERQFIRQVYTPQRKTDWEMPTGQVSSLSVPVQQQVLQPVQFQLSMDPNASYTGLPADIASAAKDLRQQLAGRTFASTDNARTQIQAALPPSDLLSDVSLDSRGGVSSVALQRADSGPPQQVSLFFTRPQDAGASYTVTQSVSVATDQQLQEAGTDYAPWVTDRYLQLPASLPSDVTGLAHAIVDKANATTPFEKTVAIVSYLRSLGYDQQIKGPARNQDAMEYFLFDTAKEACPKNPGKPYPCKDNQPKGYSQYFGSAAAVLLRSVGVPARMIAGYAAGTYVASQGEFIIHDSDRHGWAQVYFPSYGWINIEATPGYAVYSRGTTFTGPSAVTRPLTQADLYDQGYVPESALPPDIRNQIGSLPSIPNSGSSLAGGGQNLAVYVIPPASILALVLGALLLWNLSMARLSIEERTFVKMTRLGWFAGLGKSASQTPSEYARFLSHRVPALSEAPQGIASAYEARVYGHRESREADAEYAQWWRRVRRSLLRWSVARLFRPPAATR